MKPPAPARPPRPIPAGSSPKTGGPRIQPWPGGFWEQPAPRLPPPASPVVAAQPLSAPRKELQGASAAPRYPRIVFRFVRDPWPLPFQKQIPNLKSQITNKSLGSSVTLTWLRWPTKSWSIHRLPELVDPRPQDLQVHLFL